MTGGGRTLMLQADAESLHRVIHFLREGAAEAALPEARCGELDLIVEEIYINICRHASVDGAPSMVSIAYGVPAPGELKVEVADQGLEFNPLSAPPPDITVDLDDRPIGGLGVFLVRRLATSLAYCRRDGWNRLTFGISADSLSTVNVD